MTKLNETELMPVTLSCLKFISGYGQKFTEKLGDVYFNITLPDVLNMVDKPQTIEKTQAQWLIPSSYPSRVFEEQEVHGCYQLLWADIDTTPPPISKVASVLDDIGNFQYEVYTSKSATKDNQKSRILIPLLSPLKFEEWQLCQEVLNDKLNAAGITPDIANIRAAQLCYLPNRGEYYDSISKRKAGLFDVELFSDEIKRKRKAIKQAEEATQQRLKESQEKREQRLAKGFKSPIDAFNAVYLVEEILLKAGYKQRGKLFRRPESKSGSFNVSVKNSRVHALSTSDPLHADKKAHDAFSAFTVLMHGGDRKAALIDAGNNWLAIGCESFNKVQQREYAKQNSTKKNKDDVMTDSDLESYQTIVDAEQEERDALNNPAYKHETDIVPHDDLEPAYQEKNVVEGVLNKIMDGDVVRVNDESNIQGLISFCPENPLKRYAIEMAKAAKFPEETTFLAGLSIYSAVAGMIHSVCYPDGTAIPLGIYALCEQPSGTSKSRVLKAFQVPFFDLLKVENKKRAEKTKEILGDKKPKELDELEWVEYSKNKRVNGFLTNITSASLDDQLNSQNGHFMLASAEQGLIDTLFNSSGDSKADFDQLLKGFNGEYHNSKRVSREGYDGEIYGSMAVIAQNQTIQKVLEASQGIGIAERFLMLSEPNLLGSRDHTKIHIPDHGIKTAYRHEIEKLILRFSKRQPLGFCDLEKLSISDEGWRLIGQFKNELEPLIADSKELSFSVMRSIVSKVDMQIMKIAGCLHLLNGGAEPLPEINIDCVKAAIRKVRKLTLGVRTICEEKGIIGKNAEFEAVLNGFERHPYRTERELIQSRKGVNPFKEYADKNKRIRKALSDMVQAKILYLSEQGKYSVR